MIFNEDKKLCVRCKNPIAYDDDFCTHCGSILIDFVFCNNHLEKEAEGVCLVCCLPFCKQCGAFLNGIFICDEHIKYEIIEGMVRIYGITGGGSSASYVISCLEQAGFHPIMFTRSKRTGQASLSNAVENVQGVVSRYYANETKIMVPLDELIDAENVLKELNIIE
jgi:hypothetical protein